MKKLILCACIVMSLFFVQPIKADTIYYEEVIETIETIQTTRATQNKIGKKTGTAKNASGDILWTLTVTGEFTYNGSTATCTKSTVSTSIVDTRWKFTSKSSSKSGNKATATATAKCYINNVLNETATKSVTLICSPTGQLS